MAQTKIMIVDDTPSIIHTVKRVLHVNKPELSVIGVSSGQECLDIVKKEKPDIILMDIMMPGMNGWEVVAKLKVDEETTAIPVIYLSAKTDEDSKSIGMLTSVDNIEKPFTPEELIESIDGVLELKKHIDKALKEHGEYEASTERWQDLDDTFKEE